MFVINLRRRKLYNADFASKGFSIDFLMFSFMYYSKMHQDTGNVSRGVLDFFLFLSFAS